MKTYPGTGTSLVLELSAYTILTALHHGEATALCYGLLVVAVSVRIYRHFRSKRKNSRDTHNSVTS